MAIITFYSNDKKETGQTMSLAAVATSMAIEHNYKILIVSTAFNDLSLENCFVEYQNIRKSGLIANNNGVNLSAGIEGLIKILNSNKTSNDIVRSYTKIILKDRLDLLLSPVTTSFQEYINITPYYVDVLQTANKYYDMIFVDLNKEMPQKDKTAILQMSNIVVMNLAQRLKTVNDFIALREANDFYQKNNVMLAVGKYDKASKYNKANITRYIREKKLISVIPYNTLFFEACSEGTIIDFLLKIKSITDETDTNYIFGKEIKEIINNINFKLQELQMKI